MLTLRSAAERGEVRQGWLHAKHSFSFGSYHDPAHMGFRRLRVINEDVFGAGQGFGLHPHRDMEIITYIIDGALQHSDTLGKRGVIRRGEIQLMGAGTGIAHSEINANPDKPVHLLQMWLLPSEAGLNPAYGQKSFADTERQDRLKLLVSPDGAEGALPIRGDVRLYTTLLSPGAVVTHAFTPGRHGWVQMVAGSAKAEAGSSTQALGQGDGLAISKEEGLTLTAGDQGAEILLYDLD